MEHWIDEQGKYTSENRSQECVGCDCACGVFLEGIDKVVQCGLENSEESKAHRYKTNDRSEPEDIFIGCPAEDKEAGCEEDRSDHHRWQACFWNGFIAVLLEFADIEFVITS